jgi:hypothetical protein
VDGANKISFAVLFATQAQKDQDVRLNGVNAGSWALTFGAIREKAWVGIEGDAVKGGK